MSLFLKRHKLLKNLSDYLIYISAFFVELAVFDTNQFYNREICFINNGY